MKSIRFIHCADIHLDAPFTSLEPTSGLSALRRQDIKDTFNHIIGLCNSHEVQLLLISGDLFEQNYVKKSTVCFVNDLFKSISHIKVVIIPGNHDPLQKNSYYMRFQWNPNVTILTHQNPFVYLEPLHTYVYGLGFSDLYDTDTQDDAPYSIRPDYFNLVMYHGSVDMPVDKNAFHPASSEKLVSMGTDYVALGHFHNSILKVGGHTTINNPGSPEPLGFDETGLHGILECTLLMDDAGQKNLTVDFIPTARKSYVCLSLECSGCSTDEEVIQRTRQLLLDKASLQNLYKITLKGYTDRDYRPNTVYIEKSLSDDVLYVRIKDETAPDYDMDEISKEAGIRGLFVRKVMARLENTKDGNEKELLSRALYYGIEAIDKGKILLEP